MKMYVVVRTDLSWPQCAVQGGHALAELLRKKNTGWKNGTLIYLAVDDEKKLRKLYKKCPTRKKAKFLEPYWDNEMTAFAAYGRKVSDFLKKLPLLGD